MGKALKWAGRLFLALGAIVLLAGALVYWRLQASLPWTEGTRDVPGLGAELSITRDRYAIPHIRGASDEDVFFGLGYAHAQDRLWQMEMNRRLVQGRLSEVLGERTLSTDVFMRGLGFYQNALDNWQTMPAEAKTWVNAYTRGVNAVLEDPDFVPPPEFVLLMTKPEPWKPEHSVAILKLLALDLSGNARTELTRAYYARKFGPERAAEFVDPPHLPFFVSLAAEDLGIMSPEPAPAYAGGAPEMPQALDGSPTAQSNNWVLSGTRSRTGKPLLANDPHLVASQPGIWYMAHLAFPDTSVVGVSMPGLPMITLGRNDSLAWGMTNFGPDVQDLYIVKVNPENENEYLSPNSWETFSVREETIPVRFGDDVTMRFKRTRHGPVMNKDHTSYGLLAKEDEEVALAFTMVDGEDHTLYGLMRMMRARTGTELIDLRPVFKGPMQNVVFAETGGTIGYAAPGKIPLRGKAHESKGLLPTDGTKAENDWQGFLPVTANPLVVNPKSGMIVTANNKIVPDEYPYTLTNDWRATERARRITEVLEQTPRHDLETMKQAQLDTRSIRTRQLLPLMLAALPRQEGTAAQAQSLLAAWEGDFDADSPEPLIYAAWTAYLGKRIYADELGDSFPGAWAMRQMFLTSVLSGKASHWCDNQTTADITETCASLVNAALRDALTMIEKTYGPDMHAWKWSAAHRVIFEHRPFSNFPVLKGFFERDMPHAGGMDTPNVGIFSVRNMPRFDTDWIPSYRALYDLADLDASQVIIPTGQSGHPLSRHYDDLTPIWAAGEYITVSTREAGPDIDARRLVLRPKPE